MIKGIDVFDCDGVLVDSSHRYRNLPNGSIDLDYWIANNTREKVAIDKLLPTAATYRASLRDATRYTVIATARACRGPDFAFFHGILGFPQKLIYRILPRHNGVKDYDIKARGLRKLLGLKQFAGKPVTVWEDNPVTIKNLRRMFPDWTFNYVPSKQGA
jgi:hypothetical protein